MRIETVRLRSAITPVAAAIALVFGINAAMAAGTGLPEPWQMDFQGMVTEIGRDVVRFHDWLVWLITAICLFVLVLLLTIVYRFGEAKNPVPSRTTHHTMLEVAWTVV